MDSNGLKFWMLSQKGDWPLPPPPAGTGSSGPAPNMSSLESSVGVDDTQIVLLTPLPGGAPMFISVDSEVMGVNGIDSTGLQLGVTRGAQGTIAANHPPGALVLGPVGIVQTSVAVTDTQIRIIAATHPPTTTAPPATTPGPTTTPAATTTPAITTTAAPPAAAGLSPGIFLQIGTEVLAVTQVDWTGMIITVTRGVFGSTPAAYAAGTPVFAPIASNTLYYCTSSNRLQLLSMRLGDPPLESFTAAANLVETAPMTRDTFGNYARWDPIGLQVLARGSGPGEVSIYTAPAGQAVTDLAMGYDGVLYIAVGGTLVLVDRRGRWPNFTLKVPGFNFWRLAAMPSGGVIALDRSKPQLGQVTGAPLQVGPADTANPGILTSCVPNATPPQMVATWPLPSTETFVAFTLADQRIALLSWAASSPSNTASFLRLFDFVTGLALPWKLSGILWPYSLAWLGNSKAAVLGTGLNEALIFNLAEAGAALLPSGDTYVLSGINSGPFVHNPGLPPYYSSATTLLSPVALNAGIASMTIPSLTPGTHSITAVYGGDANNPAATSVTLVQTVSAAAQSVALNASANPSTPGQAVTFQATVSPVTATGTVQFLDGTTALGTGAVSGGAATLAVSTLTAGLHSITAAYSGDGSNPPSTSAVLVQTVSATVSSVTLSSNLNTSSAGQAVTFKAQVSPATATGSVQFTDGVQLKPLLPLSLNSLAGFGSTDPRSPMIVDSAITQAVWHRVFLEAVMPQRCSVVVWLTASDQPAGITAPTAAWYPHAFGDADMSALPPQTPQGVWLSIPSEVPFAQPLLGTAAPIQDRQGLFMVLIQRTGLAVRNLTGRFLGIRVELHGDRRSTPEIAALRAWASRYSYVKNYLPELYRENKFSPAADQPGKSTHRDFLERFVNIFEAQLTRIEDRVANSYLFTRPEATPDEALDWLGSWVGLVPAGYPPDRRRARLLQASTLHNERGTVAGVTLALDIATNGLCTRGAIIVVEDFRLRHIFATILGADLSIQNDPLLPGYSGSSNSFVGDTLFLGDPRDQAEVLALFSAQLPESLAEQAQVQQFFDSLANRMTIFIHNQVESVDLNLVQRVVDHEKPAHVAAAIRIATQPFMVGLAALLGVDSYLAPAPPRDPVVLGTSQIGRYNMVIEAPSLDPRLET
jgi:phage tail-like protein